VDELTLFEGDVYNQCLYDQQAFSIQHY